MRIILATNTSKTTVKKSEGKYQINGIPITVDNSIMNNIKYPADENAKGMKTLNGMPMTLTHPADNDGRNVSVFSPDGIDFYSGGKITNTYNKDGVWYADSDIDEKKLRASDMGEYFANRLDSGEPIGVSTGLTFEANNESGDGYKMIARNMSFDHLAMLHESEKPAGGDATVMRFNGEDVQVFNVDDYEPLDKQCKDKRSRIKKAWNAAKKLAGIIALSHDDIRRQLNDEVNEDNQRDRYKWVVEVYDNYFIYIDDSDDGNYYQLGYEIDSNDSVILSGEAQKVVKKFVKANAFAPDTDKGYNSQEFDVNQLNEDLIMDRSEMLEALGLATNSQVSDDELKTLMKSKLAVNASEDFTKEDVTQIVEQAVNAAVKPLQDQLTANADKELNEVAEQVAALNKGLDAEDAKALGLTKAKAFLAANSAEFVAEGYGSQHSGRSSASNKKDEGFKDLDLNAGLEG